MVSLPETFGGAAIVGIVCVADQKVAVAAAVLNVIATDGGGAAAVAQVGVADHMVAASVAVHGVIAGARGISRTTHRGVTDHEVVPRIAVDDEGAVT